MISFLKINKNIVTYSLIFLIIVTLFGFKFLISIIGNFLLLILLIPILLLIVAFISFNSLKEKMKFCNQCGTISLGVNNNCINCGADLSNINTKNYDNVNNPQETTIEVKAEEIK